MRTRALPPGWYPGSKDGILGKVEGWKRDFPADRATDAVAGVAPHAGWSFCGSMICSVLSSFPDSPDTIVILGGHNPAGGQLVTYSEPSWEFPTGIIGRNVELGDEVNTRLSGSYAIVDEYVGDNTVEVVMAMAAALYPDTRWAAWRIPADERAIEFGRVLQQAASSSSGSVAVVGSTDLTHYGSGFGFAPPDSLDDPIGWAAVRDRRELDALTSFDALKALELASGENSACSAGGAAAAAAFARASGAGEGRLLEYRSSYDIHPSDSFVGYGSIVWRPARRSR